MQQNADFGHILVQVIPVDPGREIGWGTSVAEQLSDRLDDIRRAITAGTAAVANSIQDVAGAPGWKVDEASAKFGVTLTAQAGVLLTAASAGATFEVTVRYRRE